MDAEQLVKATQSTQRLIQDEYFYKYIFKRTERIVSVVFYITQSVSKNDVPKNVPDSLEAAAHAAHASILASLEVRTHAAEDVIFQNIHTLVALQSYLQIAESVGVVTKEVYSVLAGEIDAAIRSMNRYIEHDPITLDSTGSAPALRAENRSRNSAAVTKSVSSTTSRETQSTRTSPPPPAQKPTEQTGRRAQILTIIEAKGEVGVKDISAIIKDVSEKTIQRELNDMIDDGLIIREGERRWSKYKVL